MTDYTYLIIGGGMTADAAMHGIRELDGEGSIGLISAEPHPPYNRPPLSKGLWNGQPLDDIWRNSDDLNVTLHLGCQATYIDPLAKTVRDNAGETYSYSKLLLATGGTPRRLSDKDEGVIYFRTLEDYRRLKALTSGRRRIAVIGGGYIGAEIAAALSKNGHDVHLLFPEATLLARMLPQDLAEHLNHFYESKGVTLHPHSTVRKVTKDKEGHLIATGDGALAAEVVVAGLGITPNTELAEAAGLTVSNGIDVNSYLRTSNAHIFAAGDVANIYNSNLDRRIRVEHEDNANTMGRHAGKAMAGWLEPYRHLPFFYSDLFEVGFEGVGRVDARLNTVGDWAQPYQQGTIYYLEGNKVQGVLLWNNWGKLEEARKLIETRHSLEAGAL